MVCAFPIPVGVRLPLVSPRVTPEGLLTISRSALELGYSSFWVGDHVVLPESTSSVYPHSEDGRHPFRSDTQWLDPLVQLAWLAGQLPAADFGTSVLILTLRNPTLLAKQLSTMSWLTDRPISLGVGTGWLREEYDAVGMPFEKRGRRAQENIALIRELLTRAEREYTVRDDSGAPARKKFTMLPASPAPIGFLWGGHSPLAMRLIATVCDGWLPAKQSIGALEDHLVRLRAACDSADRDFDELKLIVKPGPGPDPDSGAIDAENLEIYAKMGFHQAILELPYEPDVTESIHTLARVADRSRP